MLRVQPPPLAAYAEIRLGLSAGGSTAADLDWEVFFDDVVFDSIATPSVANAKGLPDGTIVSLGGERITASGFATANPYAPTATGGIPAGVFYIEKLDRSSGIRVDNNGLSGNRGVGSAVSITGSMQTTPSGERYVLATRVARSGSTGVKTLGTTNRAIQADRKVEGQLVRLSGTVRAVSDDPAYFTIGDGYSADGAEKPTKVIVLAGSIPSATYTVGSFVSVNGVVSKESATERVVLLRP
jgi:hypothetical protein